MKGSVNVPFVHLKRVYNPETREREMKKVRRMPGQRWGWGWGGTCMAWDSGGNRKAAKGQAGQGLVR